ncbi:uncharacterized protein AB675_3378 [Cyphellophora attinorum]|uniref:Uncharacterized protein n=1 Tax=Cyphellophora attinorum TaxID=1664694 RepID=A0A0N1H8M4_9EURO|nr:uncharacterized protein AB675_3378 [Phialophora attinorum]KPI39563.1 hypothetical protein AB675_3378 [Phialophora attinorum]
MAVPDIDDAVRDLVSHLEGELKADRLVELKDAILAPFKKPAELIATASLRPLYSLLGNAKRNPNLQLHPRTLAGILSLILHAVPSLQQQRAVHSLLDAVGVYQSEETLSAALKSRKLDVSTNDLHSYQRSLTKSLVHNVVRFISGGSATPEARRAVAQLLSIMNKGTNDLGTLLRPSQHLTVLGDALLTSDDYVLRILVADVMRGLIQNGVDRTSLWPHGTAPESIEKFPSEQHATDSWLLNARDYLSSVDQKQSFKGAGSACFWIKNISVFSEPDLAREDTGDSCAVIILSEPDKLFSVAPDNDDGLVLFQYPVLEPGCMMLEHHGAETPGIPTSTLTYNDDQGFVVSNGNKTAVVRLELEFASFRDLRVSGDELTRVQNRLSTATGFQADSQPSLIQRKTSSAFIDLRDAEEQAVVEHAANTETAGSDTQVISPLQRKSQDASNVEYQEVFHQFIAAGTDSEDDVVFPVQSSFRDRMSASQTTNDGAKRPQRGAEKPKPNSSEEYRDAPAAPVVSRKPQPNVAVARVSNALTKIAATASTEYNVCEKDVGGYKSESKAVFIYLRSQLLSRDDEDDKPSQKQDSTRFKKPANPTKPSQPGGKTAVNKASKPTNSANQTLASNRLRRATRSHAQTLREASSQADSDEAASSDSGPSESRRKSVLASGIENKEHVTKHISAGHNEDGSELRPRTSERRPHREEGSSAAHPVEFLDDSSPHGSAAVDADGPAMLNEKTSRVTAHTRTAAVSQDAYDTTVEANEAQDSHPMDKSAVEEHAAKGDLSFGTNVRNLLTRLSTTKSHEATLKTGNDNATDSTTKPMTPFGNKTKFVDSIKSAKAKSARKQPRKSSEATRQSPQPRGHGPDADQPRPGTKELSALGNIVDQFNDLHDAPSPDTSAAGSASFVKHTEAVIDHLGMGASAREAKNQDHAPHAASVVASEAATGLEAGPSILEDDTTAQDVSVTESSDLVDSEMVPRTKSVGSEKHPLSISLSKRQVTDLRFGSNVGHPGRKATPIAKESVRRPRASKATLDATQRNEPVLVRPPQSEAKKYEPRTPGANLKKLRTPTAALSSEKSASKAPVISFGPNGARNQGRRIDSPSNPSPVKTTTSVKTRNGGASMLKQVTTNNLQNGALAPNKTQRLVASSLRPKDSSDETDERDAGRRDTELEALSAQSDEGIMMMEDGGPNETALNDVHERNVEIGAITVGEMNVPGVSVSKPVGSRRGEPAQPVSARTRNVEGRTAASIDVTDIDITGGEEARGGSNEVTDRHRNTTDVMNLTAYEETTESSSSEDASRNEETSEYEDSAAELLRSASPSAQDGRRAKTAKLAPAILSDEPVDNKVRVVKAKDLRPAPRQSIGVDTFITTTHPKAARTIKTADFKRPSKNVQRDSTADARVSSKIRGKDSDALQFPSGVEDTVAAALSTTDPEYGSMRPPAIRASTESTRVATTASAGRHNSTTQDAVKIPQVIAREPEEQAASFFPERVKPTGISEPATHGEVDQPQGTPAPFHTKLADGMKQHQLDRAFEAEVDNDPTLVEAVQANIDSFLYTTRSLPARVSSRRRPMPPDSSSVEDEDEWQHDLQNMEVSQSHRHIFDTMLQLSQNALLKLVREENAIVTKATEYAGGSNEVVREWQDCVCDRVEHEKTTLKQRLDQAREHVASAEDNARKLCLVAGMASHEAFNLEGMEKAVIDRAESTIRSLDALRA